MKYKETLEYIKSRIVVSDNIIQCSYYDMVRFALKKR